MLLLSPVKVLWEDSVSRCPHFSSCLKDILPNKLKDECAFFGRHCWPSELQKQKQNRQRRFILGDVDAESELFASSDVEPQAVVVRGGEEVDDPAEGVVRAGLGGRVAALLHHHPPVNQVHPADAQGGGSLTRTPALSKTRVPPHLLPLSRRYRFIE